MCGISNENCTVFVVIRIRLKTMMARNQPADSKFDSQLILTAHLDGDERASWVVLESLDDSVTPYVPQCIGKLGAEPVQSSLRIRNLI